MAINNTGAMFKSFEFDGTDSRNFGVYITGAAVYDAPEREVEMISIPNRNGAFALDKGRFENIEITYPAGIYADTEADFAEAISDLRNFLCSKRGYCRLTDEYNPNEYRMAIYKSGLEVEPALLKAGEFEITFECMPQRYLISGETPISIGASAALTNPSLFESSPEIRVKGYGTISFNGYQIDITNSDYGTVILIDGAVKPYGFDFALGTDAYAVNNDTIKVKANMPVLIAMRSSSYTVKSGTLYSGPDNGTPFFTIIDSQNFTIGVEGSSFAFLKGTSEAKNISVAYNVVVNNGASDVTVRMTITFTMTYDATNDTIVLAFTIATSPSSPNYFTRRTSRPTITATVDGSKSVLGDPTIIDCENGEVYKESSGEVVSLNSYIDLGAELPKLATGSDVVTTSGNITECVIVPRWWKL